MAEGPGGPSLHSRQESAGGVSGVVLGKAAFCGSRRTQGENRLCHFLARPAYYRVFIYIYIYSGDPVIYLASLLPR